MRIGIRLAISGLVLSSIVVSAVGVHVLWWRTAEANSHALADTINEQIVAAVKKELGSITTEAAAAHTAIRTLFVQNVLGTREADKREFVFLAQLQAQPGISWVAFGWPDGGFFAAHKLGDLGLEMMEIAPVDGVIKRRVDQYKVVVGDIQFEKRRFESTNYKVTDQEWYKKSIQADEPSWFEIYKFPGGSARRRSLMPARSTFIKNAKACSPSSSKTRGLRNSCRSFRRKVRRGVHPGPRRRGRCGAQSGCRRSAYATRRSAALPIAQMALKQAGPAPGGETNKFGRMRMVTGGEAYAVTLTPLAFPGGRSRR